MVYSLWTSPNSVGKLLTRIEVIHVAKCADTAQWDVGYWHWYFRLLVNVKNYYLHLSKWRTWWEARYCLWTLVPQVKYLQISCYCTVIFIILSLTVFSNLVTVLNRIMDNHNYQSSECKYPYGLYTYRYFIYCCIY